MTTYVNANTGQLLKTKVQNEELIKGIIFHYDNMLREYVKFQEMCQKLLCFLREIEKKNKNKKENIEKLTSNTKRILSVRATNFRKELNEGIYAILIKANMYGLLYNLFSEVSLNYNDTVNTVNIIFNLTQNKIEFNDIEYLLDRMGKLMKEVIDNIAKAFGLDYNLNKWSFI